MDWIWLPASVIVSGAAETQSRIFEEIFSILKDRRDLRYAARVIRSITKELLVLGGISEAVDLAPQSVATVEAKDGAFLGRQFRQFVK